MVKLIEIIDLEVCNVVSISNMFENLGFETRIVKSPGDLANGKKLILPGVGTFEPASRKLFELGWGDYLRSNKEDFELMGICIGMHLLGHGSDEGSGVGLGFIDATAKLIETKNASVPHVGWEELEIVKSNRTLDASVFNKFYFSHSYYMSCDDKTDIDAVFHYGGDKFPAVISKGNIIGVQFHPEKSHRYGARLLESFASFNV